MRLLLLVLIVMLSGCSTFNYRSGYPAEAVASCIAEKWENCGATGFKVPISMTRSDNGYFVAFEMDPFVNPMIFGKHPGYSVWADVTDSGSGSATEYYRAMQISHGRIDKAVKECQQQ